MLSDLDRLSQAPVARGADWPAASEAGQVAATQAKRTAAASCPLLVGPPERPLTLGPKMRRLLAPWRHADLNFARALTRSVA